MPGNGSQRGSQGDAFSGRFGGCPASCPTPTFTLCMLMMFPQSSRYCFRSLSSREKIEYRKEGHILSGYHPPDPLGLPAPQPYQVLEDKGEGLLRVDNVMERDDVGMFEVLKQGHCGRHRWDGRSQGPTLRAMTRTRQGRAQGFLLSLCSLEW